MNSGEIALSPSACNQKGEVKVLCVRVSPGDLIAPDEPIMDVLTIKGESITLRSRISGSVTKCPVARDDTIGPDEPLLFLTPTSSETEEANLQIVALEEPVEELSDTDEADLQTGELEEPVEELSDTDEADLQTGELEEPVEDLSVTTNRVPFTVRIGDQSNASTETQTVHEVRQLYLLVDKDNKPRKLGDGSYSIVFEAEDTENFKYALKVLYDREIQHADKMDLTSQGQKADFGVTLQRFQAECRSMREIRRVIAKRKTLDSAVKIDSIVRHIGQAINLTEELSSVFTSSGLKLSRLGLVTELYHGTLKDLLENSRKPDCKETGYGILRELQFEDRIRAILPFIYNIADGLSIMHEAGYVHLDLKPANIFWRRVGKDRFEAAIGDLGYIRSARNPPVTSDRYVALGTLHYRSPEQKDFKDFCEVDILASENPEEIQLTTSDPKFMGTIVEPGDNLIFLKDLGRSFRIEKIPPRNIETDHLQDSVTQIYIRSVDKGSLNPDKRTQAVIYKNQGLRTDLFGFGAIVYDLLTCGKSPERFYNNLIVDDVLETSVTSIMDNYGHIETRSRRDPKYSHIFEPFFDGRTKRYAPKQAVTLILKCMLYRARGTYFDINKQHSFDEVLADVRKLHDKYGGWDSMKRNPLVSPGWKKYTETTAPPPNELRAEISEQQDRSTEKLLSTFPIRRVAWAALRFTQLIRLVRQTLRLSKDDPDNDDGRFYFLELAPENISILDEKLAVGDRGYSFRRDYVNEILDDVVHTRTILYDSQDPYSSFEHMGDIRRRVKLVPTGSLRTWRYHFLDSSRIGDLVKKNDWIVVPGRCVAAIETINGDRLTLKSIGGFGLEEELLEEELKSGETFFVRNLDPLGYCVSMLATYVYQLLFVGLSGNSISEPESVQSLKAQLKASPSRAKSIRELLRVALYQPAYEKGASCDQNWRAVYRRFTALYLTLSLPDTRIVFLHEHLSGEKNLLKELVKTWEDSICRDISRILNLGQDSFFSDPTNMKDLSSKLGLSDDPSHSDEAGRKMAEGILSAGNLVVHVRNILLAGHSSVESAAGHSL